MDLSDDTIYENASNILKPLNLGLEDYEVIRDKIVEAMRLGLNLKTRESSSIKMFPSFVTKLPTGRGLLI